MNIGGRPSAESAGDRGGGDAVPLPTLYEATIDAEVLEALFVDVETCGVLEDLRMRPLPGETLPLPPENLRGARERLVRGEISSIQLRYSHEGSSWLDTITPTPVGYRLVRMREPRLPE